MEAEERDRRKKEGMHTHLVRSQHMLIKHIHRNLINQGMRNPGSVVAGGDFAEFVGTDFAHGDGVGFFVAFDGDLGRHAAHCCDFASKRRSVSGLLSKRRGGLTCGKFG